MKFPLLVYPSRIQVPSTRVSMTIRVGGEVKEIEVGGSRRIRREIFEDLIRTLRAIFSGEVKVIKVNSLHLFEIGFQDVPQLTVPREKYFLETLNELNYIPVALVIDIFDEGEEVCQRNCRICYARNVLKRLRNTKPQISIEGDEKDLPNLIQDVITNVVKNVNTVALLNDIDVEYFDVTLAFGGLNEPLHYSTLVEDIARNVPHTIVVGNHPIHIYKALTTSDMLSASALFDTFPRVFDVIAFSIPTEALSKYFSHTIRDFYALPSAIRRGLGVAQLVVLQFIVHGDYMDTVRTMHVVKATLQDVLPVSEYDRVIFYPIMYYPTIPEVKQISCGDFEHFFNLFIDLVSEDDSIDLAKFMIDTCATKLLLNYDVCSLVRKYKMYYRVIVTRKPNFKVRVDVYEVDGCPLGEKCVY